MTLNVVFSFFLYIIAFPVFSLDFLWNTFSFLTFLTIRLWFITFSFRFMTIALLDCDHRWFIFHFSFISFISYFHFLFNSVLQKDVITSASFSLPIDPLIPLLLLLLVFFVLSATKYLRCSCLLPPLCFPETCFISLLHLLYWSHLLFHLLTLYSDTLLSKQNMRLYLCLIFPLSAKQTKC